MKKWRVAGISFEHMHMLDLLRLVLKHPDAELVAVCDPDPSLAEKALQELGLNVDAFADVNECIEKSRPDFAILCSSPASHARSVEQIARHRLPLLLDKPFATNLPDTDRIIHMMSGVQLAINWPLAWYPPHLTAKRLIDDSMIGEVCEVHYYGGNRGPTYHRDDSDRDSSDAEKKASWWYSEAAGGGSLLDYLGYGATLGTWFMNGAAPSEVTTVTRFQAGLSVDEQSVTIARYENGLSIFGTRWGTLTDPWQLQTQPKNGFVIVGTAGTIASYDYEAEISLQTKAKPQTLNLPVDTITAPYRDPIEYFIHSLETGASICGPLAPHLSRIGQQIIDSAIQSAAEQRTVRLLGLA